MKRIAPVIGQPREPHPAPFPIVVQPPIIAPVRMADPISGQATPARLQATLFSEPLPTPGRIVAMGTTNPRGVLELAKRLEQAFARAGGPPAHLRKRYDSMRSLAAATEHEHAGGLGLVWFLAIPLASAVAALVAGIGYGSYKAYQWVEDEAPRIGQTLSTEVRDTLRAAGSSSRWVMYLSVGAFALTGLPAAWKLAKRLKRRTRRR